jgi:hypothetical protein
MTQQDYDNDLVFRSGGKEYARIGGNGEWKPQAPPVKFEISAEDVVAGVPCTGSSIVLRGSTEEVIRVDEEGFHYNGQFIADAGEAHRLMVAFLKQNTHQPETDGPTDEELWELYDQRAGEPDDWPWIRDYARAVLALCKK